jgi:aerobic-type carbon monoxide dehydrogenase small subunit (CoxS/CutS family)
MIHLNINGTPYQVDGAGHTLLWVIREQAGLTAQNGAT